jgi:hypothetical protein
MLRRWPCVVLQASLVVVAQEDKVVAVIPARPDAEYVCRWCFGRPMLGYDVCSKVTCITHVQAVDSLDTITWRGEDR